MPTNDWLSPREFRAALALAEAIIPGGGRVLRADEGTLSTLAHVLSNGHPLIRDAWVKAAWSLDHAALAWTGHRFRSLDHQAQQRLLGAWAKDPILKGLLHVLSFPIKFAHFDRRPVYEGLGGKLNVVQNLETARWMQQVLDANDHDETETLECDVVVIGTGAGGAVVGYELAAKGHAVIFVEEGKHIRRDRFNGSSIRAHEEFYRACVAVGNTVMPVFIGRLVGGSTAVNGATCFRTPPWVLDRWCEDMRTDAFESNAMAPYFDRVESILQVTPADRRFIGKVQEVIARGCDALGYSHFVIHRNAPGCEGSGFCDFGCRTDARRSTNISYIPPALDRGATLYTRCVAERVLIERGRAVGIEARATDTGKKVVVRARAVIAAGGAIPTPVFLQKQALCDSSGQLGRNLTLHPSGGLSAQFDDELRGWESIPQGYGCDEFVKDGVLITAAQPDINYAGVIMPLVGEPLMDAINSLTHWANFGVLIAEEARGRVLAERDGTTAVLYNMTRGDVAKLHDGVRKTGDIMLAAGAKRLVVAYVGGPEARNADEWRRFGERTPTAADLMLTSYHPLGTCRMGTDRRTSVVDTDHETHDVAGLFVVDGSVVQGPLGVNPQLTIMAVATRAAERIDAKLAAMP